MASKLSSLISGLVSKTTPVDADKLPILDSTNSDNFNWLSFSSLKLYLSGLYAVLAGKSGGQTIVGGTQVADKLVLQGTSGNGTSTAAALEFNIGNNGTTTALTALNNGTVSINPNAVGNPFFYIYGNHSGASKYLRMAVDASGNSAIAAQGSYLTLSATYIQFLGSPVFNSTLLNNNNRGISILNTEGSYKSILNVNTANLVTLGAVGATWPTGGDVGLYSVGTQAAHISTTQDLGVGVSNASARVHVVKTTEQLRLGYDASNYASFTVDSTGNLVVGNNGTNHLSLLNSGQLIIQGDATTDLPVMGAELLTSAGWTVNAGWTESPDDTFAHSSGTDTLTHSATITSGYKYQISWTVTGRTAGSFTVAVGGQSLASQTATGTFGPTTTATTAFTITPTTDFNGTISAISLKQLTAVSTPGFVWKTSAGVVAGEIRSGNAANNCFVGVSAGGYNTTGSYNSAVGFSAQFALTTGSYNSAIGINAQYSITTGSHNSAIGNSAGRYQADGATALTDPEYSIYIGYAARGKDNDDNNSVVIGGNTPIGLGANTTVIGTSSTTLTRLFGNVATGIDAPSAAFHAVKTTEQLRLGYDASNYASFTVSSAGNLTLTDTGTTVFTDKIIENTVSGEGIILKSPDGTRYKITVANGGTLSISAA